MGILTDLSIAYEILADDPIETGIRFGKSVLGAMPELFNQVFTNNTIYAESEFVRRPIVSAPRAVKRPGHSSVSRGEYLLSRNSVERSFRVREASPVNRVAVGVI